MPERRTSSVRSFVSNLHFSGKVIMASVLFGFGLLLVGAILLVIATGGQKGPPLKENSGEKMSPMTFIGPGVMGVGAFFVIVGTIMCLLETRILRRRRHTEHDSLINAEIVPTRNEVSPNTDEEGGGKNQGDIDETKVKTVQADIHTRSVDEKLEKVSPVSDYLEKGDGKELSASVEIEQVASFNASVYVDALDDNDDNHREEFITESVQFSTPPEGKPQTGQQSSFNGQQGVESQLFKSIDPVETDQSTTDGLTSVLKENDSPMPVGEAYGIGLHAPKEKVSSLLLSDEKETLLPVPKESSLPVSKEKDSSLPVQKEKESSLPEPEEKESSLPTSKEDVEMPINPSTKCSDVTKEKLQHIHSAKSPPEEAPNNGIDRAELQEKSGQAGSSAELLNTNVKNSAGSDFEEPVSVENTEPTET